MNKYKSQNWLTKKNNLKTIIFVELKKGKKSQNYYFVELKKLFIYYIFFLLLLFYSLHYFFPQSDLQSFGFVIQTIIQHINMELQRCGNSIDKTLGSYNPTFKILSFQFFFEFSTSTSNGFLFSLLLLKNIIAYGQFSPHTSPIIHMPTITEFVDYFSIRGKFCSIGFYWFNFA